MRAGASSGPPPPHGASLARNIAELVRRLGASDPAALDRLRSIVGDRRAWIGLADEAVEVAFDPESGLVVTALTGPVVLAAFEPAPADRWAVGPVDGVAGRAVDGVGATSHQVVVDLMNGRREVTDAIIDGDIEVRGSADAVLALFAAVDILIDAAARIPSLRELAARYLAEHDRPAGSAVERGSTDPGPVPLRPRTAWPPNLIDAAEDALLAEHGLHNGG